MTFNPAIPQSTDLISTSQGQILDNFNQLNVQFGIEHTPFYTGSGNGDGFHKKATMPDTASVSPSSNHGTYYVSKTGSIPGNITEAVYKSGDASAISILSAVKAWGIFTPPNFILDGFNFLSFTNPSVGEYVISFTNNLNSNNYAVLVSCPMVTPFSTPFGGIPGYDAQTISNFKINIRSLSANAGSSVGPISFVVLQS